MPNKVYTFYEYDDGSIAVSEGCNHYVEAEELYRMAEKIIQYADDNYEEIPKWNEYLKKKWEEEYEKAISKKHRGRSPKCVYMLECNGKYKIGVSADVKRRANDLDKRPYEINIVASSNLTENAFEIEREIHSWANNRKIHGEWFDLDKKEVSHIKKWINSIGGENA